jgi:hypothetical protein
MASDFEIGSGEQMTKAKTCDEAKFSREADLNLRAIRAIRNKSSIDALDSSGLGGNIFSSSGLCRSVRDPYKRRYLIHSKTGLSEKKCQLVIPDLLG